MSALLDRVSAAKAERAEEDAQLRKRVSDKLRWISPAGISAGDLWVKLGRGGDVAALKSLLEQLAEQGQAHTRDRLWYHGPGAGSEPELVAPPMPQPRTGKLDESCADKPGALAPRTRWEGEPTPPPAGLVLRSAPAPAAVEEPPAVPVPPAPEASAPPAELPGSWVVRRMAELELNGAELARRAFPGDSWDASRDRGSLAATISKMRAKPHLKLGRFEDALQRVLGPYTGEAPASSQPAQVAPRTGGEENGVRRDQGDLGVGGQGDLGGAEQQGRHTVLDDGAREEGGRGGHEDPGRGLPDAGEPVGGGPGAAPEDLPEQPPELGVEAGEAGAAGLTLPPPPPEPVPATLPELLRRAAAELEDRKALLLQEENAELQARVAELQRSWVAKETECMRLQAQLAEERAEYERQVEDLRAERDALVGRLPAVRRAAEGS